MGNDKNRKEVIRAWLTYYWANSVYPLVITTALFPIYYSQSTKAAFDGEVVTFLGIEFINSALYSYALSFSFLIITLISPILSGLADYSGLKKSFLVFFTILGATASSALFFFEGDNLVMGLSAFVLASVGFSGSHIFYNAYLPQIATYDRFDKLSAQGFSAGYIGSALMLIICLIIITFPAFFGLPEGALPTRVSFLLVGIWWLGFGFLSFIHLPPAPHKKKITLNTFTYGFRELKKVEASLKELGNLKKFLTAFFLFSTGLQTILLVAVIFAEREIDMPQHLLIATILIIQFVAVGGAFVFSKLSKKRGNLFTLITCLIIWSFICGAAYFVNTATTFMILAGMVGLVMGGTQAISRSTFTKLLPERKDHNAFFSFYEILEKMAIAIGTLSFGMIEEITGSMRNSALFLIVFFLLGIVLLYKIKDRNL